MRRPNKALQPVLVPRTAELIVRCEKMNKTDLIGTRIRIEPFDHCVLPAEVFLLYHRQGQSALTIQTGLFIDRCCWRPSWPAKKAERLETF